LPASRADTSNAIHGYALPDRDVHHKGAANRDWERIFSMFHRRITVRSRQ